VPASEHSCQNSLSLRRKALRDSLFVRFGAQRGKRGIDRRGVFEEWAFEETDQCRAFVECTFAPIECMYNLTMDFTLPD
jgi:hypothetical protein